MRLEHLVEIRIEELEDYILKSKEDFEYPICSYRALILNYSILIKITDDNETRKDASSKMKEIEHLI